MLDAPSAPTQGAMLTADEVELVADSVRFYPDTVARRAVGGPLGEVTIAGVRCTFRRASLRDLQTIEAKLGKPWADAYKEGVESRSRMALMALTPIDGGTLPEDAMDIPAGDSGKLGTVLTFFLAPGTLVARSAGSSPKTTGAESNGQAAP